MNDNNNLNNDLLNKNNNFVPNDTNVPLSGPPPLDSIASVPEAVSYIPVQNNINTNQITSRDPLMQNSINSESLVSNYIPVQDNNSYEGTSNYTSTSNNMNNQANIPNHNAIPNNTFNSSYNNLQNNTNLNQDYNISNAEKGNKKTILLILAIIAIVGIGLFVFFKFFNDSNNTLTANLNSVFDPNKPIIVKKDDKYGYITSEGDKLTEFKYTYASNFYDDYAVVGIDNPDEGSYFNTLFQIIDKNGTVKLSASDYSRPKYLPEYKLWEIDNALYNSKLNKISSEEMTVSHIDYGYFEYIDNKKNEIGIIDHNGKKVFKTEGNYISAYISENDYNKEDLYAVVIIQSGGNEKRMVISLKTGDILFTQKKENGYSLMQDSYGIFHYFDDNTYQNRKFLFFINNKLAYQTTEKIEDLEVYDYKNQILKIDYGWDYEELGKNNRFYYYDVKNKKMLESAPENTQVNSEAEFIEKTYGFKETSCNDKVGLMEKDKQIVPCEYEKIGYLNEDLFNYMNSKGKKLVLLQKDSKTDLYDINNSKKITTFNTEISLYDIIYYIDDYKDSTFIKVNQVKEGNNETVIYNLLTDKSMSFDNYDSMTIGSNYLKVKKDNQTLYYNTNFKQVFVE